MGTRLSLRIAVHRAKPSIPGIMISRMIRSGQDAWNASNRLFPSSNVSTSYPSLTRNVCIKVRICSSSSATYMRFAIITSLHVTVFTDSIPSRQESVNRCHIFAAFFNLYPPCASVLSCWCGRRIPVPLFRIIPDIFRTDIHSHRKEFLFMKKITVFICAAALACSMSFPAFAAQTKRSITPKQPRSARNWPTHLPPSKISRRAAALPPMQPRQSARLEGQRPVKGTQGYMEPGQGIKG